MAIIPQEVFDAYNAFADDFINLNFGINCRLVYPALVVECDNCLWDNISNKSTNIYKAGGPVPFNFGVCPWCGGLGTKETSQTEAIKMRIYFSRKDWIKVDSPINIPDGSVQAIGFITDLPKVKQAQVMQIATDLEGYIGYNYILAGEPIPHGFKKNRYMITYWSRD